VTFLYPVNSIFKGWAFLFLSAHIYFEPLNIFFLKQDSFSQTSDCVAFMDCSLKKDMKYFSYHIFLHQRIFSYI
jgi:hypothetical protein